MKSILDGELAKLGVEVSSDICEHFPHTRQDLYNLVMVEQIKTFDDFPQADMNQTTLLIPVICGQRHAATIDRALPRARQIDLANWERQYSIYSWQEAPGFFDNQASQKA